MTNSWESICVVKQVKWKKNKVKGKRQYVQVGNQQEAEMKKGESGIQGNNEETSGVPCS